MKVKYKNELTGQIPSETQDLLNLVKNVIDDDFSEGKIETLEAKLDKIAEILGKFIDIMAERKVLNSENINTLLSNYKYSKIRLIESVKINYVVGDATEPKGEGKKIIAHICNDENKWGAGFVLALSKKWKEPELDYKVVDHKLGEVQFVQVEKDITVANMVAQKGIKNAKNLVPLVYGSLQETLMIVAEYAIQMNASVHAPRFGAGLAGGSWDKIEYIINNTLIREGISVFIYDLPEKPQRAE